MERDTPGALPVSGLETAVAGVRATGRAAGSTGLAGAVPAEGAAAFFTGGSTGVGGMCTDGAGRAGPGFRAGTAGLEGSVTNGFAGFTAAGLAADALAGRAGFGIVLLLGSLAGLVASGLVVRDGFVRVLGGLLAGAFCFAAPLGAALLTGLVGEDFFLAGDFMRRQNRSDAMPCGAEPHAGKRRRHNPAQQRFYWARSSASHNSASAGSSVACGERSAYIRPAYKAASDRRPSRSSGCKVVSR